MSTQHLRAKMNAGSPRLLTVNEGMLTKTTGSGLLAMSSISRARCFKSMLRIDGQFSGVTFRMGR